jgi:hypothetical protein
MVEPGRDGYKNCMSLPAHKDLQRERPQAPERGRHLRLVRPVEAVGGELRHLREIEEEGDGGATALIVVAQVLVTLVVVVSLELVITFAFYFGWL